MLDAIKKIITRNVNNYKYDESLKKWVPMTGDEGGASALSDLTDLAITDPEDGQLLRYNSTTEKWENFDPISGNRIGVTADGTKTRSQLLDELYALIVSECPTVRVWTKGSVTIGSFTYKIEYTSSSQMQLSCRYNNEATNLRTRMISLLESGSSERIIDQNLSTGAITTSDTSSQVPADGTNFCYIW